MSIPDIPTYRDLLAPTLRAILSLGGSGQSSEIEEEVIDDAGISEAQLDVLFPDSSPKSGTPKIIDRLSWARTYLKKMGYLENSQRGVWALTRAGKVTLEEHEGNLDAYLKEMDNQVRRAARLKRKEVLGESGPDGIDEDEPNDDFPDWKSELLSILMEISPSGFEHLCLRLLREAGFKNLEIRGRTGDGGIDGVGVYRVSLVSFPTYFQCKRYRGSVGAPVVRDFRGAMAGRGEKGMIITTGTFTSSAKDEASRDGAPPLDLIDGDELCGLLKNFNVGVSTKIVEIEEVTVDPDFFSSF